MGQADLSRAPEPCTRRGPAPLSPPQTTASGETVPGFHELRPPTPLPKEQHGAHPECDGPPKRTLESARLRWCIRITETLHPAALACPAELAGYGVSRIVFSRSKSLRNSRSAIFSGPCAAIRIMAPTFTS